MANEAFALSPIAARAAEPNEQDYDAIREAFMETSRGRWFLGEYAKRNRNADTRMVLDAVAKIEEALAAQRQPVVEDRLPEALVEIRRAIGEAEAQAIAAFDPATIEQGLGPVHRGVRIIKEISWRWREIGADGRICDLIDSQLASIEAACAQVSAIDPRAELKSAFDLLRDRVEQTNADRSVASQATSPASAAPMHEAAASVANAPGPEGFSAAVVEEPEIAAESGPAVETIGIAETTSIAADALDVAAEAEAGERHAGLEESLASDEPDQVESAAVAETGDEISLDAAAEAEDEAVLERIAMEMAAPDPEFDELVAPIEASAEVAAPSAAEVQEPAVAEPEVASRLEQPEAPIAMESLARLTDAIAEAAAEVTERPVMVAAATSGAAANSTVASPLPEPSLGATILASGMLERPRAAANDALAPIRRMTQAEKIAFFS